MKKNVMMRVASALLVAVLMTTCAISGTFAKYTTTASGSDNARVARWGFTKNTLTVDMFDGSYTNVQSGDSWNVLAPGTTKTTTIDFQPAEGTPEVAYTFDVTVNVEILNDVSGYLADKLVWTVNGENVGNYTNIQAKIDALYNGTIAAGDNPVDLVIVWTWAIGTTDADHESDTALGNATTLPSLTVTVSYTATQVG